MNQTAIQRKPNPAGLAPVLNSGVNKLTNVSMKDLTELAEAAFASGMFADVKNAGIAKMKILAGREIGLEPIASLTAIHFFNNRIVYGAGVYAGLIKDSQKYEYEIVEHTGEKCVVQFYQFDGDKYVPSGPPVEYNKADAKTGGVAAKDNYTKWGDDMYFAGAMRKGFRRHCMDLLRSSQRAVDDGVSDTEYLAPPEIDRQPAQATDGVSDVTVAEMIEEAIELEFSGELEARTDESRIEDLRIAVNERIQELTQGEADDVAKLLNGRNTSQMDEKALTKFYEELNKK